MLENGSRAPDFTLIDTAGVQHTLSQALTEGPVVLAFFKADCPTCTLAFPYLERLHQSYRAGGWHLWSISQNPSRAAEWFNKNTGVTFPTLIDGEDFPVSCAYDPPATPTIFFIDRQGTIQSGHYGLSKTDLNALAAQVAAALGQSADVIAPADDGNPEFKPG
ncbi:MAG: TlpA disulfide reductase family protein [Chloroflexota bacterium]